MLEQIGEGGTVQFKTIFDARDLYPSLVAFPTIMFVVSIIAFVALFSELAAVWLGRYRIVLGVFLLFYSFITINTISSIKTSCGRLVNRHGFFGTVEGHINNLKRENMVRIQESLDVAGATFRYGENYPNDGYHILLPMEDLIANGRHVRITFTLNKAQRKIVKIEMKQCDKEVSIAEDSLMDCIPQSQNGQ